MIVGYDILRSECRGYNNTQNLGIIILLDTIPSPPSNGIIVISLTITRVSLNISVYYCEHLAISEHWRGGEGGFLFSSLIIYTISNQVRLYKYPLTLDGCRIKS